MLIILRQISFPAWTGDPAWTLRGSATGRQTALTPPTRSSALLLLLLRRRRLRQVQKCVFC